MILGLIIAASIIVYFIGAVLTVRVFQKVSTRWNGKAVFADEADRPFAGLLAFAWPFGVMLGIVLAIAHYMTIVALGPQKSRT